MLILKKDFPLEVPRPVAEAIEKVEGEGMRELPEVREYLSGYCWRVNYF